MASFREIKIRLNRPVLDAHYRQDYFAYPDMPNDSKQRQAVMADALNSPLASTGPGLVAAVVAKTSEGRPLTAVRTVVDAHEIAYQQNAAGKPEAMLDFLLVIFDEKGERLNQLNRSIRVTPGEAMLKNSIAITADSEVPPQSAARKPENRNDVLRMERPESSGSSIIPVSRPENAGFYFRRRRYLRGFGPPVFGGSSHLYSSAETAQNELEFTYLYPEPRLRRPHPKNRSSCWSRPIPLASEFCGLTGFGPDDQPVIICSD